MNSDAQTTVIGAQTTIKGDIEVEGSLTVLGRIEGAIRVTHTLAVEPAGVVLADIEAADVAIGGALVGNISASDAVRLATDSRVVGDIVSPRVALADGAAFRGAISMGAAPAAARPAPATRVAEPVTPARTARTTTPVDRSVRPTAAAKASATRRPEKAASRAAAAKKRSAPRPPTTAGKKSRVKRK